LIREMFNEQDSKDVELNHVECMGDAEKYLADHAVDPIRRDWRRYGGLTPPLPTFPWWCFRARTTSQPPCRH
jgi:hypothetical protein